MFKMIFKLFFVFCVIVGTVMSDDTPIVQTKNGPIQGYSEFSSFNYLGIPYAMPPVGDLRWQKPVDAKPWSPNTLNATAFQPACPQVHSCSPSTICPPSFGEDCLYLNVYVPQTVKKGDKKAVMFFIHGGNFQFMGASSPVFNSTFFAGYGDVIVVTINYRLGALGFLVTGLEPDQIQGNFGIMDQRMAIKWTHDNIEAFGGDPDRITIFGQSAGAESVSVHLLSSDMQEYFNSAIVMSSPMSIPFRKFEETMALYMYFASLLNCTARDIACLKSKTIDEIVDAQMKAEGYVSSVKLLDFFEQWLPWIDGKLIKGQLLEIDKWIGNDKFPLKPFIIGTLTEECVLYVYGGWSKPVNVEEYLAIGVGAFKKEAFKMLERFPPALNLTDQRYPLSMISTKWVFSCSSRNFLETYMKHPYSMNNVYYMYVFDYPLDWPGWGDVTYCEGHVCHGGDMPYTFDIPDGNFTSNGHQLSISHILYWSNYAKTGSPNNGTIQTTKYGDLVNWPKYEPTNRYNLRFKTPPNIIETNYLQDDCDFFDSIGYYH